jgi:hypothetical protein
MINHNNGTTDATECLNEDKVVTAKKETVLPKNNEVDIVEDEDDLILKFDKPYKFEGKEYKEVDLNGFEDVTADLLCGLERNFSKKGISSVQPEVSISYAVMLAAEVCELPIEFFNGLPGKEAIKLKNMVVNFFYA